MNRSVLDPSGYVYVHERMLYGIGASIMLPNGSFVGLTDLLKLFLLLITWTLDLVFISSHI